MIQLIDSFNSETGERTKPKQDKDILFDILEYEAHVCKSSKNGKCELVLMPYLLEMY